MNRSTQTLFRDDDDDDAPAGPLGEAVAFIRAQPAPRETMRRAVAEAAGWAESPPPGALPSRRWGYVAALAAAAAMFVVAGIIVSDALDP